MPKDEALKVLGLSLPFDTAQLKSAYRKVSLQTHPDRGGNAEEFRRATEAYEALGRFATIVEKPTKPSDPNAPCDCVDRGIKAMINCKRCFKVEVKQPNLRVPKQQVVITPEFQEKFNRLEELLKGKRVEKPKEPEPEQKAEVKSKIKVETVHIHLCPECGEDWECKDESCERKKVMTCQKCQN